MPSFTLQEVIGITQAKVVSQDKEKFSDLVSDTRKITEGVLFLAFKGEKFNGEDFAAEALKKGAAGVMVSLGCAEEKIRECQGTVLQVEDTLAAYQQLAKAWRERFPQLPVIAITGSNGKTTTKDLTAAAISARGPVLKTQADALRHPRGTHGGGGRDRHARLPSD